MDAKKFAGRVCCAVGCHNSYPRDKEKVNFFCFSKKNLEQRELWVQAVHRVNPDGSKWLPKDHSRICSQHFIGGKPSPTRTHPDYVPSVFPTKHKASKSESGKIFSNIQKKIKNDKKNFH